MSGTIEQPCTRVVTGSWTTLDRASVFSASAIGVVTTHGKPALVLVDIGEFQRLGSVTGNRLAITSQVPVTSLSRGRTEVFRRVKAGKEVLELTTYNIGVAVLMGVTDWVALKTAANESPLIEQ